MKITILKILMCTFALCGLSFIIFAIVHDGDDQLFITIGLLCNTISLISSSMISRNKNKVKQ